MFEDERGGGGNLMCKHTLPRLLFYLEALPAKSNVRSVNSFRLHTVVEIDIINFKWSAQRQLAANLLKYIESFLTVKLFLVSCEAGTPSNLGLSL